MMKTLLAVGQHKISMQFVQEMIDYPSHKHMECIPGSTMAHALYLKRVHYNKEGIKCALYYLEQCQRKHMY